MINLINRECGHTGCATRPNYGVAGTKDKVSCRQHAEEDMASLRSTNGLSSGVSVGGEALGRGDSAVGGGATAHGASAGQKRRENTSSSTHADTSSGSSRKAHKRARQVSADVAAASTPVGSEEGENPAPAEDPLFVDFTAAAAAVKMETGLFEGRPRGSFRSRRNKSKQRTTPAAQEIGCCSQPDARDTVEEAGW